MKEAKSEQNILGKDVYFGDYVNLILFISYYYQIALALELKPKNILEVGCGNKTVSSYLKQSGCMIDTCDINQNLEPDYVADIRELPFKNNSYSLVTAYEVLEHIPWSDIDKGLNELKRVSKRYVIISLPYPSFFKLELVLNNRTLTGLIGKKFISLLVRIPPFFKKHTFNGYHYWEIGKKGYSLQKIKRKVKQHFKLLKVVRPVLNPYHIFFVLEKETNSKLLD